MQKWTSKPLSFVHDPKAPIVSAALELVGVDQRVPSFSARLYLNNPRVDEESGTDTRGYAGFFSFFGHGENCWGDHGHCEIPDPVSAFDKRAESASHSANITVDITEALAQVLDKEAIRVTILAWAGGDESTDPLSFDELMLVTYS